MAQPPAVVIIARHGMRLDAADQSWHLSTPTPYDPPLTYGGWNQCRTLGVRIASLLDARERSINSLPADIGESGANGWHTHTRKKRRHRVVIHTSPFQRCLQTSVAISAGMAQYEAPKDRRPSTARSPATMHSASPRLRGKESAGLSPSLAPIAEPRHTFARDMARKALGEPRRHRKAKIRVDAFLGEWLNPSYFDQITPPPPSPMMVAGAKAELMQNDTIDIFTPTLSHKSSGSSLWNGPNVKQGSGQEGTLDDWSHVTEALDERPALRRERSNSASSFGSTDTTGGGSSSGRRSPFRPGGLLQPLTSTIPKPEPTVYRPPAPSYAVSSSDHIPRGYVAHARNATVNVDYQWDSSRAPLNWGSGGEFGEEWSSMHKRFRRGLNNMLQWYSQHNADDRGEDALGIDQAEKHHEEEDVQEDLVVILVTHGAGSNALIGALTNQPVLLDVGMASLTMAVRKEYAPPLLSPPPSNPASPSPTETPTLSPNIEAEDAHRRRSSLDIGLSAIYDMKLVSSSEHLRPGVDPTKVPATNTSANIKSAQEALARYKQFGAKSHAEAGATMESSWNLGEPANRRANTSTAIGSIRRPSTATGLPQQKTHFKSDPLPPDDKNAPLPSFTTGLWTPPSSRGTPLLSAQHEENNSFFTRLSDPADRQPSDRHLMLNFITDSPPDSRPASRHDQLDGVGDIHQPQVDISEDRKPKHQDSGIGESDDVTDVPFVSDKAPPALSRGLSQKGLWGNRPSGAKVPRTFAESPKRRWTMNDNPNNKD